MTTFQDQPWSRRAVRDGDTGPGAASESAEGEATESGSPVPPEQQTPRQVPLSPRPGPEPLSYVTQQRFSGEFRVQRPERFEEPDLPATQQLAAQDRPSYRPRDYSPEGRGAVPSWAPTYTQTPNPFTREGSGLDYHTQARPDAFAARADEPPAGEPTTHGAHAAPDAAGDAAPANLPPVPTTTGALGLGGERTITRRELRAIREAEEAAAAAAAASAAPAQPFVPSPFAPPAPAPTEAAPTEPASAETPAAVVDEVPAAAPEAPAPAEAAPVADVPVRPWSPADEVTVPRDEPQSSPPVALVEPPEPARWSQQQPGAATPGAPSVFEALFTPSRREPQPEAEPADAEVPAPQVEDLAAAPPPDPTTAAEPVSDTPQPWAAQPVATDDPFVATPPTAEAAPEPAPLTLDELLAGGPITEVPPSAPEAEAAAPSPVADPFVPVPPPGWQPEAQAAPEPIAEPEAPAEPATVEAAFVEPAFVAPAEPQQPAAWQRSDGDIVDAEVIAEIPAPEPVAEPHPVVIDATPLPAEPIDRIEPPIGHWSTQDAAADEVHDFVGSRDVHGGHGVITTNALVLPVIPQPEFNNPLASTGEILITGSIELPRSLSATGAHESLLEESSLDHELDPGDHQVVSTESAPVRAVRAVSTHTHSGGVIAGLKPRSNRPLTALIIATAVMAGLAATLIVVGLLNGAF